VIDAIVDCVRPGPKDSVFDPACGTGGFLIASQRYIVQNYGDTLDADQRRALNTGAIRGVELVRETVGFQNSATVVDLGFLRGPLIFVEEAAKYRPTLDLHL
jgi:hypothetical protein